MFRDILLGSRAIFIGLVFFIVVVGGSLLYSWHVHRTTDAELAETRRKVQPLKNDKAAHTAQDTVDTSAVDFEHAKTPLETGKTQMSEDTEALPIDETSEMLDMADAFLPDDFVSEEAPAEDVPVSPFGLGSYPEIPEDYPKHLIPPWAGREINLSEYASANELLDRVLIKLWTQGDKGFTGGSTADGKVYPHYPNTVYVRYKEIPLLDGTVHRAITKVKGGPEIAPYADQILAGTPPAHIRLIDLDISGVDPYTFLNIGE